jgi:hypothetical protein
VSCSRSSSNGTGGTSSRSFSNSAIHSAGKRSTRVDRSCPSLMNVGPSEVLCALPPSQTTGVLQDASKSEALDEVTETVRTRTVAISWSRGRSRALWMIS